MKNETGRLELKKRLAGLADAWLQSGLPARGELDAEAERVESWKTENGISGLWPDPPVMVTATIDDGMGMGLQIINRWAEIAGLRVSFLGILKNPEEILDACRRLRPRILGITVLQFDTEDDLIKISENLPSGTQIVAGGPVFKGDPEFAGRAGIHFVAKNLSHFLKLVLEASFLNNCSNGENA